MKTLRLMKKKRGLGFYVMVTRSILGLLFCSAQAQEAMISFPFSAELSSVEADLGVRVSAGGESKYKSGTRTLPALGVIRAGVRFVDGEPIAIQPHALTSNFGRGDFRWSFVFDQDRNGLVGEVPIRRSVGLRGLALSMVNDPGLPWFPIDDSGRFNMEQLEFEAKGVYTVDGTEMISEMRDLADEWSFDLDVSGTLQSAGGLLKASIALHPQIELDKNLIEANLSIRGDLQGASSHPFFRPRLRISFLPLFDEVKVSWGVKGAYILLRDTDPAFPSPISVSVSTKITELRIPVDATQVFYFRLQRRDE